MTCGNKEKDAGTAPRAHVTESTDYPLNQTWVLWLEANLDSRVGSALTLALKAFQGRQEDPVSMVQAWVRGGQRTIFISPSFLRASAMAQQGTMPS